MPGLAAERHSVAARIFRSSQKEVLHVEQVVLDPLMEIAGGAIVTADLPEAGNARPHREPRFAPGHADLIFAER